MSGETLTTLQPVQCGAPGASRSTHKMVSSTGRLTRRACGVPPLIQIDLVGGKYPDSGRGGDVYHALSRIHKLVPGVGVLRLLALGLPITADADDRRLRAIGDQLGKIGLAGSRHILSI